jgi:hypothetical protein
VESSLATRTAKDDLARLPLFLFPELKRKAPEFDSAGGIPFGGAPLAVEARFEVGGNLPFSDAHLIDDTQVSEIFYTPGCSHDVNSVL